MMTAVATSGMLHSSTTSIERSKSQSPQSSVSSSTIHAQSQKAAEGSHSVPRISSRSRAVSAPIKSMEEVVKTPSIPSPDCPPQTVMDRSTLENDLSSPESGRGLADSTADNVPNFRDVLRQQSQVLKHQDDASAADSKFSESTNVPRRNLKVHDVAALILNKVVGSGIFTTPGLVLALTKDKTTSIILWVIGGIHAMLWYVHSVSFQESTDF